MLRKVEAKIIECADGQVSLEIEHQKLKLDAQVLPKKISKESKLNLYFLNADEAITVEKKLAKTILEEILNGK